MKTSLRLTTAAFGLAIFNLSAGTLFVSLESTNPTPPYTNWLTAATNIQDAVDASHDGDTVLVGDGVYSVGERTTIECELILINRVVMTNAVRLESVNGPSVTTIDGRGSARCVYLGDNAVLSGFTLTNGYGCMGGGAHGGTLYSCTLVGNRGANGGGACDSTLFNCTVIGNSADVFPGNVGGGAYGCTLYNCTVSTNRADYGSGTDRSDVYNSTLSGNRGYGATDTSILYNCVLTGNSNVGGIHFNCTVTGNLGCFQGRAFNSIICGNTGGNFAEWTTLNYCLTSPLPTNGVGNIDADPKFVDAAAGDFHLRPDSSCIDAGTNLVGFAFSSWRFESEMYNTDPTDILGNARGVDGNNDGKGGWDIGAYEYGSFKPPRFAPQVQATPSGFQFSMSGESNKPIQIERSSDLVNWAPWIVVSGSSNAVPYMDPQAGVQMFYRAVVE